MITDQEKKKSRNTFKQARSSYDVGYADGRHAVVRKLGFRTESELSTFVHRYHEPDLKQVVMAKLGRGAEVEEIRDEVNAYIEEYEGE